MSSLERAADYLSRAEFYLDNAEKRVKSMEDPKAGEFLWGAIAVLLKGIGTLHGQTVENHAKTIQFGEQISAQRSDPKLLAGLRSAEKLHANYYESFLKGEDFLWEYGSAKLAYDILTQVFSETYEKRIQQLPAEPASDVLGFFDATS